MNDDLKMKLRARRILRALNNMREGAWRNFMMSPQDRIDAAWLNHRYGELQGQTLFSEASMQAGTEFLLMVIRGDDRPLTAWAETHRFFWCDKCGRYRVGDSVPVECRRCFSSLVLWTDLEMEWVQFKGKVLNELYTEFITLSSAWVQLRTDEETLREWVLDDYFTSRIDQPTACRVLGLDEAALIATRFPPQMIECRVDDLPPLTRQEAIETVRRVARIEE